MGAVPPAVVSRYWSTTVTAEGLVVRVMRRRSIPWTEITDIAVDEFAGDRFVYLTVVDGSRKRLPAPVHSHHFHDAAFDDRYAAIVRTWQAAHR